MIERTVLLCFLSRPQAPIAMAAIQNGTITPATRLEVPPKASGMRPPSATIPAAAQIDQIFRCSCPRDGITSRNSVLRDAARQAVTESGSFLSLVRVARHLPPGSHVRRLAQGHLLDEEGGDERQRDDGQKGHEDRMEGVGQRVPDACC